MWNVARYTKKAEKAKKEKAALGEDIELEEFETEKAGEHEEVESLEDLPKNYQNTLRQVGVDPDSEERGGSFMMMDQSSIMAQSTTESIELMNIRDALENTAGFLIICGMPYPLILINILQKQP